MLQVCDEPCDHGQGDSGARTKHELAFHRIQRKRIDHSRAALAVRAYFTGKLSAFAECLAKNYLGESAVRRIGSGAEEMIFPSSFSVAFNAA